MTTATATATAKGTKGKATGPKVEVVDGKVEGVLIAKVKHELVDKFLASASLPTTGKLEERVARLVRHYRSVTPPAEVGDCNACGGDSDLRPEVCPVCPYCGEGGVVDAPKGAAPATATAAPAKPEATAAPAKPEAAPEPAKPAEPVAAAKKANGKAETAPAPEAPKTVTTKDGQTLVATKGKAAEGKTFTVADLDAAIAEVEKAKQGEVASYWDLGHAIHRIFSDKLYLQRREKKGDKPLYETWGAFCVAELGMSGGNAYRVMDVATNYDRETAVRLGVRKLNTLLRVENPEKRTKLLGEAAKLNADDLATKVAAVVEKEQAGKAADRGRLTPAQKARNTKGSTKVAEKGSEAKASNVAKPVAADPKEKITAALALGRTTVKLFAKGAKITDPEAKRAKRLADGPFGVEETVNGVVSRYTVTTDAKGALVLVIERKRT